MDFREYVAKGGKKDRKNGLEKSNFNQISFIERLLRLTDVQIQSILTHADQIGLTDFEIDNFKRIDWLRFVCNRFGSPENYPDAFHLWAAERNDISVFLTLDKKLSNIVGQIRNSKQRKHNIRVSVFRPISFLESIGISTPDKPPIEAGRFYSFVDVHK